jgi:sporulation protein YlmC with PRC-barrel domain
MKVWFLLSLLATVLGVGAAGRSAAAERPGGARVEVDRSGVHVDLGNKIEPTAVSAVKVRDLIGLQVLNRGNESLGKIEDLVMDPTSGRVRYAVLSFGGFLGMGDKLFAVPWNELALVTKGLTNAGMAKEDYCILDVSKDALKQAPGFDKNKWPDFANPNWGADVDKFYMTQRAPSGGIRRR